MTETSPTAEAPSTTRLQRRRARRMLVIIGLACISPFVASFALYYWWTPPGGQVNYGTLIEARKFPVESFGSEAARGKWLLVTADPPQCEQRCQAKLYATRQSRTMTGKERDRVTRVWLLTADGTPDPALLAQHPDIVVARVDPAIVTALPADVANAIWIVDPRGNLILRYPAEPDIKGLYKDLARLLFASRIG